MLSASPNVIAHTSGFVPNDPGQPGGAARRLAERAVELQPGLRGQRARRVGPPQRGRPPRRPRRQGRGARHRRRLRTRRGYKRSPDLLNRFVKGYDFVDNDAYPDDLNGHGTHVASTIAETTGNGFGVTGLAYGTRIMPVRVLDRSGTGDSVAISAGIRYAARKGAKVINLSFEFDSSVTRGQIPDILDALRYARRKGALVIGASGNFSAHAVAYPARATHVMSVGATTEHVCQADYSNSGSGPRHRRPRRRPRRRRRRATRTAAPGREPVGPRHLPGDLHQPLASARFGLPSGYVGTSMAAPHVSATAALVIASGVIGPNPSPAAVEARLKATARDLGTPGRDPRYGWGLVDAARAVSAVTP